MDLIGDRTLRDLLEEKVALCPDRELLVFEDRDGAIERYTYREFDTRVNQVANGLLAEGMTVRVAVRHPDPARIELRSIGFDRVTVVPADVPDEVLLRIAGLRQDATGELNHVVAAPVAIGVVERLEVVQIAIAGYERATRTQEALDVLVDGNVARQKG